MTSDGALQQQMMLDATIKGQEYNFTFDSVWGPMYLYEEVAGEKMPFNPRKTACLHLLFYCILLRSNPGFDVSLEEFLILDTVFHLSGSHGFSPWLSPIHTGVNMPVKMVKSACIV